VTRISGILTNMMRSTAAMVLLGTDRLDAVL